MSITSLLSNAALSAYSAATSRKAAATDATDQAAKSAADTDTNATTDSTQTDDSVQVSSTGSDYSNSIASNTSYFPVRPGMAADALVLGVSQPGAVSSSKDKSFADVATDARKRMDEKYALMKDRGTEYSGSDADRNSLLGDLDRRSLYAVATNQGGQFSADEQKAAKAVMNQQEKLAMGFYSGPADQAQNYKDPYANDPVGRAKAALAFLDSLSPEEKADPAWLTQHLTLEDALQQSSGQDPAKKTQGHFHNLSEIMACIDTDGSDADPSQGATQSDSSGSYVFEQVQAQLRSALNGAN